MSSSDIGKRLRGELEPLVDQVLAEVVLAREAHRADLAVHPGGEAAVGEDPAAQAVPRLEDRDLVPGLLEQHRRRQARDAGPGDDDVPRLARSARQPVTQGREQVDRRGHPPVCRHALPHLALDAAQQGGRAAEPQRADHLGEGQARGDVVRDRQDGLGRLTVEAGVEDSGEPAGGRGLGGRIGVDADHSVRHFGGHEQRRLALRNRLEPLGVRRDPFRQRRQRVGVLEEHLEPVAWRCGGEVLDDLGEGRWQRAVAHVAGSTSRSIGIRTALPHSVHEPS